MNHIKLNDDYRQALLESANWDRVGLAITEDVEVEGEYLEEATQQAEETVELTEEEYAEYQEAILDVIIEESIDQEVFGELIDRAGAVHAACSQISEATDEYDDEEIVYAALQEVFPTQFPDEE